MDKESITHLPEGSCKASHESRRDFLKQSTLLTALALTPAAVLKAAENDENKSGAALPMARNVIPATLLDKLRDSDKAEIDGQK